MLNSFTTKLSLIRLARAMKRSYIQDPVTYPNCPAFENMKTLMANVKLENLILPPFPNKVSQGRIHFEDMLRISVFFIPKGTEMPLHDHPSMFVLCKVLKGKLIRDSYKLNTSYWQFAFPRGFKKDMFNGQPLPTVWATKTSDMIKQDDLELVTPEVNLHRFVALQNSIFLDVISPDYDDKEIFLNYYQEKSKGTRKGEIQLQMKPTRKKQMNYVDVDFVD